MTSGKPLAVRAAIDLAGLKPDDVRVELVLGRIDSDGHLEDTEVMSLPAMEQQGSAVVFGKDIIPERTGRLGYALAGEPESLRGPADAALRQPAEMEPGGVGVEVLPFRL